MRPLNFIANRFVAYLFSHLVNTRLTDTLCGTNVLLRKDREVLEGVWLIRRFRPVWRLRPNLRRGGKVAPAGRIQPMSSRFPVSPAVGEHQRSVHLAALSELWSVRKWRSVAETGRSV
jgi:hypothetical protein